MNRELFPILLTVVIVGIFLGVWLAGRQSGWFLRKSVSDVNICRNEPGDTLSLNWRSPGYGITGWSVSRYNDDVLHLELMLHRGGQSNDAKIYIDTMNVRSLEIYGKTIPVKDIPLCE
ncbi:hypothetical protein D0T84_17235 [Dysgonomonas sp. 521]|uniref:hypothetical protein n=1 Tax=Dysgonomonas sp. 521 TaxID=2302932 RepID=UPI0013D6DEC4|nr:hypothetical protein [Dysgonomonas sp. 521]NDV96642.1 hypothetical protein [Dysgonomonas sp. 521]